MNEGRWKRDGWVDGRQVGSNVLSSSFVCSRYHGLILSPTWSPLSIDQGRPEGLVKDIWVDGWMDEESQDRWKGRGD